MELLILSSLDNITSLVMRSAPFWVTFSMFAIGASMLKGSWTQLRDGVLRTCECRSV